MYRMEAGEYPPRTEKSEMATKRHEEARRGTKRGGYAFLNPNPDPATNLTLLQNEIRIRIKSRKREAVTDARESVQKVLVSPAASPWLPGSGLRDLDSQCVREIH